MKPLLKEDPMKTFILAFAAAILMAVQLFTPVAAAPSASVLASEACGTTYTVKNRDNLSKIASLCGVSVADILALNPQITNPNLIFTGQVLRISGSVKASSYTTHYTVKSTDTLSGIASMFGITVWAIQAANPYLYYNAIYTGQVLNIPASTYVGNARVSLSTTTAGPGDSVTVYVRGFPANSSIDYRVGEDGEKYSAVYDGTIDSQGSASATITIPSTAHIGEYWVVLVTTTSQKNGIEVTSHTIYIND
jgi:LysM repeat protein